MIDVAYWLPLLIPMTSLLAGIVIFFLGEQSARARTAWNLASAMLKLALVGLLLWGVYRGQAFAFRMHLFMGFELVLRADALSLLFVSLSSFLWLVTTLYAVGYLEGSPDRSRFFGFFSLCVSATTGVAMAGNLFTYLFFYELLTLTTYPLVVHRGTKAALEAGRVYLLYTLTGGLVLLLAMVWLSALVGAVNFQEGGILAGLDAQHHGALIVIFAMLMVGFGVKAALVPLHGWLPIAMIAPAPVSALLHAVAVVKAGAFGIVRVVYDIFGVHYCQQLQVLPWLVGIATVTILYGSLRALFQDDLKRRLAYSTVSQLSYIVLGVAVVGPLASIGGIVHIVHQGLMKITMFFCAGNLAEELHLSSIRRLNGVGRRMPLTMTAFTVAALGMIGVPPLAGFISKWHLGWGCLEAGQGWILIVLVGSSLLNAAYFLPIIHAAWFKPPDQPWPDQGRRPGREVHAWLLIPPLLTALATLLCGVLAGSAFSPLRWARMIMAREYGL
jgi:multicomponent Na+:H+ antiporter subunit D